jgi:hypothetical protein
MLSPNNFTVLLFTKTNNQKISDEMILIFFASGSIDQLILKVLCLSLFILFIIYWAVVNIEANRSLLWRSS